MPQVPDPASTCPFFDRMRAFTQSPQDVVDALTIWTPPIDFIDVAVAYDIIRETQEWSCDCQGVVERVDEREYLEKYWFHPADGWWTSHPGFPSWKRRVNNGLRNAFIRSRARSLRTKSPAPVDGLWVCYGNRLEVVPPELTAPPPHDRIVVMILTPPPGCDCRPL